MTDTGMKTSVEVPLGQNRYTIQIGDGLLADAGRLIRMVARSADVVIITQPVIAAKWVGVLTQSLERCGFSIRATLTFPSGERYKTLRTVTRLYEGLYDLPADRKTLIVAVGGGVVGDVAGYVAATYLRGLDYVQIPTTLLAMVDSSLGGKTGVDFAGGKNLVGAFHQPRLVVADVATLDSLPAAEITAALGEIVKYGCIAEPDLLEMAAQYKQGNLGNRNAMTVEIVRRCCAIKADLVARDEREENGLRAGLNFGHTVGHALESATNYRRYRHGQAVAMGMAAASYIGRAAGRMSAAVCDTILNSIAACGLDAALPADISDDLLLERMVHDKKADAGKVRFVFVPELGRFDKPVAVDAAMIREGLQAYRQAISERAVGKVE